MEGIGEIADLLAAKVAESGGLLSRETKPMQRREEK
jgi:hypothetical protein